ncbi:lipoate--protein ligase family protein [Anaerolineales bacterium]
MSQWRLIIDNPTTGIQNMAIDSHLLQSVSQKVMPPTLRIYAWQPMCLSLGYGQSVRSVDEERLNARGWQMVRRPTGGLSILHGDELTYSLSIPIDHPLAKGDVVTSYRRISVALLRALQFLGLNPEAEVHPKEDRVYSPVCFETPSHYEITVDGRKLLGSAQVRKRDGILQHGTLPLFGDIGRICEVLAFDDAAARQAARDKVYERATTLESVLGENISWEVMAEAMIKGFEATFDVNCQQDSLSEDEWMQVDLIAAEQYANDNWMYKR